MSVSGVPESFSYVIDKTWDGKPTQHGKIDVTLLRKDNAVEIHVEAPFMNDPPAPDGEPGNPFPQLWDYEVVEAFFLNEADEYLEVEVCPKCGENISEMEQSISVPAGILQIPSLRKGIAFSADRLPLNFTSEIKNDHWTGRASIPFEYFPPNVSRFNAYAIHGSGCGRVYEALYEVPGNVPDFHRLEYFGSIDFYKLVPENTPPAYKSTLWGS